MFSLYRLPGGVRIFFSAMLAVALVLQTIQLYLLSAQNERAKPVALAGEAAVLLHLLISAMMIAVTQIELTEGNIASLCAVIRFADIAPIVLGVMTALLYKNRNALIPPLFIIPLFIFWDSTWYAPAFLICNLCLMLRTALDLETSLNVFRHSVTQLSVKEAIDKLPSGVLYLDRKGLPLIQNIVMSRLLSTTALIGVGDMPNFWERLCGIPESCDIRVQMLGDKLLLRIARGGSWLFSKEEITVKAKTYTQILAFDVSEQDRLTQEIEQLNNTLEATGAELTDAMGNIEQIEKAKEILRIKSNIHDLIGQRLFILHQFLEDETAAIDIDKIKLLLSDLLEILADNEDISPHSDIHLLVDSFAAVGTELRVEGSPPDNAAAADTFVKILRECTTNACRHGGAKTVNAVFGETELCHTLSVSNDGAAPDSLSEGGGIKGMRGRLAELGGCLEIELTRRFCITATIPKIVRAITYENREK